MNIAALVDLMMRDGTLRSLAQNPRAQFGTANRQYLGATILPERTVTENAYREDSIRYRTIMANDGARYSPSQKKGNEMVGSFLVELGDYSIAREFNAQAYDTLLKLLGTMQDMQATVQLINWMDTVINRSLIEKAEVQRWQAICGGVVLRRGDNAYSEDVPYPNPAGQRVVAAAAWSNDANDPFEDIAAGADFLSAKGYTAGRMVTGRDVLTKITNNAKVKARVGKAVIAQDGSINGLPGRATREAINNELDKDGLPTIETYDLQYHTQTGSQHFYPRGNFTIIATTGRDETLDLGDNENLVIGDTLGYYALGRATGQAGPGRVMRMEAKDDLPPRIDSEGWATGLPVITDPEAMFNISGIS